MTLGHDRNLNSLGATKITSKENSDKTKVATKNEKFTSFGGIYHIMDIFSRLGLDFDHHGMNFRNHFLFLTPKILA